MNVPKYYGLRRQAEIFGDHALADITLSGKNVWSALTCQRYGLPYEELPLSDPRRRLIKYVAYGMVFCVPTAQIVATVQRGEGPVEQEVRETMAWLRAYFPSFGALCPLNEYERTLLNQKRTAFWAHAREEFEAATEEPLSIHKDLGE